MTHTRLVPICAVLLLLAVAVAQYDSRERRVLASNTSATPEAGTPVSQEHDDKPYCVTMMVPRTDALTPELKSQAEELESLYGKPVSIEEPGERYCFATIDELKKFKVILKVNDDPATEELSVSSAGGMTPDSIGSGPYLVSSWYDNAGFDTNGRIEQFLSPTPCSQQSKAYTYVGNWINDRMSSFRLTTTYGCYHERLFKDAGLSGGGPYICATYQSGNWPQCWYVGNGINDVISSWTLS